MNRVLVEYFRLQCMFSTFSSFYGATLLNHDLNVTAPTVTQKIIKNVETMKIIVLFFTNQSSINILKAFSHTAKAKNPNVVSDMDIPAICNSLAILY